MSGFESIEGLTLTDTITAALQADGITAPLPVQTLAMASMLAGKHVLMHAGTGSGKTIAYVLPLLQHLREHPDHRAVVVAPGAELVMQTLRVVNAYKDEDLTTGAALSTTNTRRQRKRVTRSTRLVVGTPDRLIEMFSGGKLKGVRVIVFDELEPILGSRGAGFFHELLSRSTPKVQILVASATMGGKSDAFVQRFMADGEVVRPAEDALTHSIQHRFVRLPRNQPPQMTIARFL